MRRIKMRVIDYPVVDLNTGEEVPNKSDTFHYKRHLSILLRQPVNPQAGMTFDEMVSAFSILDKIKDAKHDEAILLEEAEWEYLRNRIEKGRYSIAHEAIRELANDIRNAEKVDVRELDDGSK